MLMNLLHLERERRGRDGERVLRPTPSGRFVPSEGGGGAEGESSGGSPSVVGSQGSFGATACGTPALRETLSRGFFQIGEDTEEATHVEVLALFSSPLKFRTCQRITPDRRCTPRSHHSRR